MGGAFDEVALVEVVGADSAHEEFVDEFFLDVYGVVDAIEENALVAHNDAGVGESAKSITNFGGEFLGMIGVNGNEQRVIFFEHFAERWCDALWQENRDA